MKKKIVEKNKVLESAAELFHVREDIIGFFEKGIFQFKGNVFKTKEERSEEKFVEKIYNYEITLDEGMDDQTKLEKLIIRLENYKARSEKKKKKK